MPLEPDGREGARLYASQRPPGGQRGRMEGMKETAVGPTFGAFKLVFICMRAALRERERQARAAAAATANCFGTASLFAAA